MTLKSYIKENRYCAFAILGVLIIFIIGYFLLGTGTTEKKMLSHLEKKYNIEFSTISYINSDDEENDYIDILMAIPSKYVKDKENPIEMMSDKNVTMVYYNRKTDEITDDYFGVLIRDSYYELVNNIAKKEIPNSKLYFSVYNSASFPDEYTKETQLLEYMKKQGDLNGVFCLFVPVSDEYTVDTAKEDVKKLMESLKKQDYVLSITTYFMKDTKLENLTDDTNESIGIMNETEKNIPENITYTIDGEFNLTEEKPIEYKNDGDVSLGFSTDN